MTQRPVVFFGQAPVHIEPRERALDNPAPGVDAEIGFLYQYVPRFPDPDAVALGQVLAENAVKGTVHENDLDDSQQFVRGGYLVPESNGSGPVHRVGGQPPTGQYMARSGVSVSTKRLRPLTHLPASKPPVAPVAVAVFLTLCVSSITAVGQAFFERVLGCSPSGRRSPAPRCRRLLTCQRASTPCPRVVNRPVRPARRTRF